jgi:hypothetical protein
MLSSAKLPLYVRRKFTDAIYNDSNPGLRDYALAVRYPERRRVSFLELAFCGTGCQW